jgi:hypothetical protein
MPRVGFETTTPVFEQEKTLHTLDPAATVIDMKPYSQRILIILGLIIKNNIYIYIYTHTHTHIYTIEGDQDISGTMIRNELQ